VAGITGKAAYKRQSSIHINTHKSGHQRLVGVAYIAVHADGLRSTIHLSLIEGLEVTMAKGQMRSNREKKKPKQDKNKKKGAEASSPFTGMHSQVKLGTSYTSQYGKKH
jgi:hypothetical protein